MRRIYKLVIWVLLPGLHCLEHDMLACTVQVNTCTGTGRGRAGAPEAPAIGLIAYNMCKSGAVQWVPTALLA
jgi:hypothetical protein